MANASICNLRRNLIVLAGAILCALLVAGCSGTGATQQQEQSTGDVPQDYTWYGSDETGYIALPPDWAQYDIEGTDIIGSISDDSVMTMSFWLTEMEPYPLADHDRSSSGGERFAKGTLNGHEVYILGDAEGPDGALTTTYYIDLDGNSAVFYFVYLPGTDVDFDALMQYYSATEADEAQPHPGMADLENAEPISSASSSSSTDGAQAAGTPSQATGTAASYDFKTMGNEVVGYVCVPSWWENADVYEDRALSYMGTLANSEADSGPMVMASLQGSMVDYEQTASMTVQSLSADLEVVRAEKGTINGRNAIILVIKGNYNGVDMYLYQYFIDIAGMSQVASTSLNGMAVGTDDTHLLDNMAATFAMTADESAAAAKGESGEEGLVILGEWEY